MYSLRCSKVVLKGVMIWYVELQLLSAYQQSAFSNDVHAFLRQMQLHTWWLFCWVLYSALNVFFQLVVHPCRWLCIISFDIAVSIITKFWIIWSMFVQYFILVRDQHFSQLQTDAYCLIYSCSVQCVWYPQYWIGVLSNIYQFVTE